MRLLKGFRHRLACRADGHNIRRVPYYCPHCGQQLILRSIGCEFHPHTGQRINVSANFLCPHGDLNPGHFRYKLELWSNPEEKQIRAWWGQAR